MKKLVLLVALLAVQFTYAKVQNVLKITSDVDSEITKLEVIANDASGKIEGLTKLVYSKAGKLLSSEDFTPSKVMSSGAVMSRASGRDVVVIKAPGFNLNSGGVLTIDYLYSGISGTRKQYKVSLKKSGGKWQLSKNSRNISWLFFKANKKAIIGTIGVKEIIIKK